MKLFRLVLLLLCCILPGWAHGQDARYAQFYTAPLLVNPALTGVSSADLRLMVNYRNLYSSLLATRAFLTYSAGFDLRFKGINRDYIGLGFTAQNDQAGLVDYRRFNLRASAAYLKHLSTNRRDASQYLVGGIQGGLGQQTLGFNNLWFSNQFNTMTSAIDPTRSSGEDLSGIASNPYLDLHAGLLWYAVFNPQASVYFGLAGHHLNQPSVSFLQGENIPIYRRFSLNAGGELPLSKAFSVLPAALIMQQGPSLSATLGNNIRYSNNYRHELALKAGAWLHLNNRQESGLAADAITFVAIFEVDGWNLGFSYDVTVSALQASNYYRGAFETSFSYRRPEKSRKKLICPDF